VYSCKFICVWCAFLACMKILNAPCEPLTPDNQHQVVHQAHKTKQRTSKADVRWVGDHLETFCLPQVTLRSQLESWGAGR
jgi:hypothetical protein